MNSSNYVKMKILHLAKLFHEKTDDEHSLTTDEICSYMEAAGYSMGRKAVPEDVEVLNDFGMDIICENKGKNNTYHLVSGLFDPVELKLLVQAVEASKFRNVTALFSDPDWDGPIEIHSNYDPNGAGKPEEGNENGPGDVQPPPIPTVAPVVDRNGCRVEVINRKVSIYDTNGKLLRQESIVDYTKENILGEYASPDKFIAEWRKDPKKDKIRDMLLERGIDLELLKADQNMPDVDDFDFICHVAYDKKPLTRKERANNVKKRDFLYKYSGTAREVLEALLEKYMNAGISEIVKTDVLKLDPFMKLGKPAKIATFFGGKAGYMKAVQELQDLLYEEAI